MKYIVSHLPTFNFCRFGASCETLEGAKNDETSSSNQLHQTSGETNVSATQLLDDFSHFLQPGPFLTSEEVDGIGSIRTRLEEIQDQVSMLRPERSIMLVVDVLCKVTFSVWQLA